MSVVLLFVLFVLFVLFSFLLTGFVRKYALIRKIIDTPNIRSSHVEPTPRGGGLAIVITFVIAIITLHITGKISLHTLNTIVWPCILVALTGFVDDHQHIPARWRLVLHFIASGWVAYSLTGLPILSIYGSTLELGVFGYFLAIIYLTWILNLYNFMDGINGIAAIEAVTVCIGGSILLFISNSAANTWLLPTMLIASTLGFLYWNFPKARIFMGDVGSGFIGITLGILSLQAAWLAQELLWAWMILLGTFIVDATLTLIRRLLRYEKIYNAHRSHAYQYASRKYNSHTLVTIVYGGINMLWLLPVALLVVTGYIEGVTALLIAYTPLVLLAIKYKAGASELQEV